MSADGNKYIIHYNQVGVLFPIISETSINIGTELVGTALVESNTFTVDVNEVLLVDGSAPKPINTIHLRSMTASTPSLHA